MLHTARQLQASQLRAAFHTSTLLSSITGLAKLCFKVLARVPRWIVSCLLAEKHRDGHIWSSHHTSKKFSIFIFSWKNMMENLSNWIYFGSFLACVQRTVFRDSAIEKGPPDNEWLWQMIINEVKRGKTDSPPKYYSRKCSHFNY